MKPLRPIPCFLVCASGAAFASDASFTLTATADFDNYVPGYLANGYVSTADAQGSCDALTLVRKNGPGTARCHITSIDTSSEDSGTGKLSARPSRINSRPERMKSAELPSRKRSR